MKKAPLECIKAKSLPREHSGPAFTPQNPGKDVESCTYNTTAEEAETGRWLGLVVKCVWGWVGKGVNLLLGVLDRLYVLVDTKCMPPGHSLAAGKRWHGEDRDYHGISSMASTGMGNLGPKGEPLFCPETVGVLSPLEKVKKPWRGEPSHHRAQGLCVSCSSSSVAKRFKPASYWERRERSGQRASCRSVFSSHYLHIPHHVAHWCQESRTHLFPLPPGWLPRVVDLNLWVTTPLWGLKDPFTGVS